MIEIMMVGWCLNLIAILSYIIFSIILIYSNTLILVQKEIQHYNTTYKNDIQVLIEFIVPFYALTMFTICLLGFYSTRGKLGDKLNKCVSCSNKFKFFKVN
jgi:hypothetical protein